MSLKDLDKLFSKEKLIIINCPGASQEEINTLKETIQNCLVPKEDTVLLLIGHKKVKLLVQEEKGIARSYYPRSIILKLINEEGYKIRKEMNTKLKGQHNGV